MQNVVLGIKIYNNVKKEQRTKIIIWPFHAKTGNIEICLKCRPGLAFEQANPERHIPLPMQFR